MGARIPPPRLAARPSPLSQGGQGGESSQQGESFRYAPPDQSRPPCERGEGRRKAVAGGFVAENSQKSQHWRKEASQGTPKKVSTGEKRRRRELPKKSALEKRGVAENSRKSQHWRKEALQSPLRKSPSAPQWSPESSPPASPGAPAAPSRSPPPSAGSESRRKPRPKIPTSSATPPAGRPANSGPPS